MQPLAAGSTEGHFIGVRVLSLYYMDKPGGFCKRLYRLLGALAGGGHEVHFLALDRRPPALPEPVLFHRIPFPFTQRKGLVFWLCFTLWGPLYTAWFARKIRPDRFAVFGAYYGAVTALARAGWRAPIILFIRSLVFEINRLNREPPILQLLSNVLERFGMRRAGRLVVMSESMRRSVQQFAGRLRAEIVVLPNDVPKVELVPEPNRDRTKRLRLLTSGVLDTRKNVQFLLHALRELKAAQPEVEIELTVAGSGPLLEEHQAFARRHGLPVQFPGWLPSLAPLYPLVDLVVHPSLHEGVSNSVLEALAAGLPVIAADTPEMRELLAYQELLFSLHDSRELQELLRSLAALPEKLKLLKSVCDKRAAMLRFDWDARAANAVLSPLPPIDIAGKN